MEQYRNEEMIRAQRRHRIDEMKRRKERQLRNRRYFKRWCPVAAGVVLTAVVLFSVIGSFGEPDKQKDDQIQRGAQEFSENSDGAVSESREAVNISKTQNLPITGTADVAGAAGNGTDEAAAGNTADETDAGYGTGGMDAAAAGNAAEDPTPRYSAQPTEETLPLGEEIISKYALLIDLESDSILAQKGAKTMINPASMTKILTVLVAAEHVTDLDDTFTMTLDITDYSYVNDCSNAGFLDGEEVTVRDLFYGTVLPSGADAAAGLATYVAGSMDAFVELMNQKLEDMGLSGTAHMTNCVGLYDEAHYCTIYDMAMILEAALENDLCREVLSAHTYTTSVTEQHPEGILLSNWFLRRIEDKDTGGIVMCGKTGYVAQSGNCAASYAVDKAGKGYICVTADATSGWRCIYDHVALYKKFSTKV